MSLYQLKVIKGCVDAELCGTKVKHFLHLDGQIVQYSLPESYTVGEQFTTDAGFIFEVVGVAQ